MLTSLGYRRRTFDEILDAKIAKAKELFGEEINTDNNTALGKYIRINAYDQYAVEELAESIYYSAFPQTASGKSLDRLGWTIGMQRNAAIPAQYKVLVTGTADCHIECGFLVGTEIELNFYAVSDAVIGAEGTCEIIVECVEAGLIGNISPSDIDRMVNPNAEIDSVVGVEVVQVGEEEESDYDFLKRYEIVREGRGSCTEAAIKAALVNIPTVNGAHIIINESATETVDDIPPKSIACYIDGGANYHQEIAEAIFDKKPLGVKTYGDQSVAVTYGGLTNYNVNFSHAATVNVYINLTITTSAEFEESGNANIRTKLQEYIDSLGIGVGLVTTTLYSYIYSVSGVSSALVEVSTDGAEYSSDNINVATYECCTFAGIKINGVEM